MTYITASGIGTSVTKSVTIPGRWTLRDLPINNPSRSYLYQQMTNNFITNITWSTSTAVGGGQDKLFYYIGDDASLIININVDETTDMGDNPPLGWFSIPGYKYDLTTGQSGTLTVPVREGNYLALLIDNSDGAASSAITLNNVPEVSGACVLGSTLVLMHDNSYKNISDIIRGDIIIEDIETNKTNIVAKLYYSYIASYGVKIPKNLINNFDDLICTGHPIWCNNDQNRIYAFNINDVEHITIHDFVYNIQFEDEGTFYANGVKVDSLPPYNPLFKLPQELYFNPDKYDDTINSVEEDTPFRNKPLMTSTALNFEPKI